MSVAEDATVAQVDADNVPVSKVELKGFSQM